MPQSVAFGVMNAAWALGAVTGPAAGGAIAGATGDWIPYLLGACACGVALIAVRPRVARRADAASLDPTTGA